jgi:hypothetical protein
MNRPMSSERVATARSGAPARRGETLFPMRALSHVLVLAGLVVAALFGVVFLRLGGLDYYRTPLGVRGYTRWHPFLRPSGAAGQLFGIAGLALILVTLLYAVRKKLRGRSRAGPIKVWLEVHIFCGIVGPAFITLHTSFKFNGLISIAYWSMVLVVLSGFVGRYLFVRIPKSIRGTELSLSEIEERAAELREGLAEIGLPAGLLARMEGREPESGRRPGWRRLRRDLRRAGVDRKAVEEAVELIRDRDTLLRRIAKLGRRKRLFELWHIFHKPLVYLMLAIAALHVGLTVYLGYSFPGLTRR